MAARLPVRLFAVLLFAFAMSVAQPAHAATLTVNSVSCAQTGAYAPDPTHYGTYSCTANVSGGTGGNTYTWTVSNGWYTGSTFVGGQTITGVCKYNTLRSNGVTVRDSSGATASGGSGLVCRP
ncbi:MAG TPA: hypothetical protein VF557_03255 [Jatrophihabitans sp.]|jgi:hypothetical protein|uniref:hypothetical protein n=1 Tax=Jatrophihabitans sp. TaxID=1932789 RepID=UPI002EEDE7CB